MFILRQAFKYTFWAATGLFAYHLWAVEYKDEPDQAPGTNAIFLDYAKSVKYMYEDLTTLMTRPAVDSLLLPRPPLP